MKKKIDGFASALQALRGLAPQSQERILAEILKKDPEMADRLKKNLITFDDILRINPQGFLKLYQEIAEPQWALALRGKDPKFIETLLKPLAKRKADLLREAIGGGGPQPLKKVEEAQKEILNRALKLAAQGLVIFAGPEDPLV